MTNMQTSLNTPDALGAEVVRRIRAALPATPGKGWRINYEPGVRKVVKFRISRYARNAEGGERGPSTPPELSA